LQAFNHSPEGLIRIFAHIVPILNGRDSEGHVIYLGPQRTKIHRYLLIIFLAKSAQMFRLSGKEIDNSIYFTLYALKEIANSFKDISPYHLPLNYDRSKVASKVYFLISNNGLVDIKKIDGDTYITGTEKGDTVMYWSYCNHALLRVHADQAEEGCHPGPESRAFMADLQMLATYPVYGIILNVIPFTYPAIVGFLIVAALPNHIFTRGRTSMLPNEPPKRAF
jgi:hypothetical protein